MRRKSPPLLVLPVLLGALAAAAAEPAAGPGLLPVVGQAASDLVEPGQTLLSIAATHRLGFEALQRLNPGVDPWIPEPGTIVRLPTRLLMLAPAEGLVINLPEMRLYDFTVEPVEVLAVAIGDPEDPSPIGSFVIGQKRTDPAWNVPRSILEEKPGLPRVVPPGPDNPLGSRWLTIGRTSYGLHGTNIRWSIGRTATHGCIRLFEADVQRVFERVPEGTPVELIYAPFKWGREGDVLLLEAHSDLYSRHPRRLSAALAIPRALGLLAAVDIERTWRALDDALGVPVPVGRVPSDWQPPAPTTSKPRS